MHGFKGRRNRIGSDLYFSKINLVFGDSWITVERMLYFLPLRSHAVGDGDLRQ